MEDLGRIEEETLRIISVKNDDGTEETYCPLSDICKFVFKITF